ncbi:MAG: hypothetical protein ACOCP8_02755 [archaeon]
MNFDEAIQKVVENGPNEYAKTYAKAMPQAIEEAEIMNININEAKAIQANYILANLEDYPSDEMKCLTCGKAFDELEFEEIENCQNCNSNKFDVKYVSWDTEEGKEVRKTLKAFTKKHFN